MIFLRFYYIIVMRFYFYYNNKFTLKLIILTVTS